MKTPFSTEQFFSVFEKYNTAVFPAQIILILAALVAMFMLHSGYRHKNRVIALILSMVWFWNGIVYQWMFFADINRAANIFGAVFSLEAAFILYEGAVKSRLKFSFSGSLKDYAGYFFIIYGLFIYPLIDVLGGSGLNEIISLGLPCPGTIMTFGFFLLSTRSFRGYLLIIPSLWAFVGLSAALNFGIYQDIMMLIAAILSVVLLQRNHKRILRQE